MSKSWQREGWSAQWAKTRLLVLKRDGYRCQIKGPACTHRATQVDHIKGRGVSERLEDLRAACAPCNQAYRPPSDPSPRGGTQW